MKQQLQLLLLAAFALLAPFVRAQTVESLPGLSSLFEPYGIAVDIQNNAYWITDGVNNRVIRYDPVKGKIVTLSGVFSPQGIAVVDRAGLGHGVVVADPGSHQIKFINATNGVVTTLAGSTIGDTDNAVGKLAKFASPAGLAVASDGTVFVADLQNNLIRRIDNTAAAGVTTVAPSISFNHPAALALGPNNVLYVADTSNDSVKVIDLTDGSLQLEITGFDRPRGLLYLGSTEGTLLVADTGASVLRMLGGTIRPDAIYAGVEDVSGFVNGSLEVAEFAEPVGLALDSDGAILVADLKNNAIRRILREQAIQPSLSPPSGTYNNAISLSITNDVEGATVLFSTNTSIPTIISTPFTNGFVVDGGPTLVQVRSYSPDLLMSEVTSNLYTFAVADPSLTPAGQASDNVVQVHLTTLTTNATFFWTTDGTIPANGVGISAPNGSFISVARSGTLRVIAVKPGYDDSQIVSADFTFASADPVIIADKTESDNDIQVTLSSHTEGATLFYTTDGRTPTTTSTNLSSLSPSVANNTTLTFGVSGPLSVVAHRDGFADSQVVTKVFSFKVGNLTITPQGATNNDTVSVTASTTTIGATIVWTIDGSTPSLTNGTQQVSTNNTFIVPRNGTLRVIGFKAGYAPSDEATLIFHLQAPTPIITLTPLTANGTNINTVTVTLEGTNTGSTLKYTLDGKSPVTNGIVYTAPFAVTTNANLQVAIVRDGFLDSPIIQSNINVQVDAPVLSPPGGFFQDGTTVTLTVLRPDAKIYYTTDGTDPSPTNGVVYTGPLVLNRLTFPASDLRQLRARAFAPNTSPSEITTGNVSTQNTIGLARPLKAGIGANIIVPIVMSLKTGDEVRSLIYRLQVFPITKGAPNLANVLSLSGYNFGTNDFVTLLSSQGTLTVTNRFQRFQSGDPSGTQTNEVVSSFLGQGSNLQIKDYGTVNLVGVRLPASAHEGDVYGIQIVEPSATSDGIQNRVQLDAAPLQTITIQNIPYIAGDSSPGGWYNAGDFGDGDLDSADVNNAYAASLGIRKPFSDSDVFDAMDVFPDDEPGFAGGDGQIRLLDWQLIHDRALRIETENWSRVWSIGGIRLPHSADLIHAPIQAHALRAQSVAASDNAIVWSRQASLEADTVGNAQAGQQVSLPLSITVKPGVTVSGLEFRAVVEGSGPALTQAAQFQQGAGIPAPTPFPGLPLNEVAAVWDLDSGLSLQGHALIGNIVFTIPAGAVAGQSYHVRFIVVDGAKSRNAAVDMESLAGSVWIGGPAQPNPFGKLSDEWRVQFFGSLDNVTADPNGDPDGDGVSNLDEYLAGTDPTQLRFHQLIASWKNAATDGFTLRFFSAVGKTYVIESATDAAGPWTQIASVPGNGTVKELLDTQGLGQTRFYRIHAEDSDN